MLKERVEQLKSFLPDSPEPTAEELPFEKLADTLVLVSNKPRHASQEALAASILAGANAAENIVSITKNNDNQRLDDYFDRTGTPDKVIVYREASGPNEIADQIKELAGSKEFGEVAILSAGNLEKEVEKMINKRGLHLKTISPKEMMAEMSKRIEKVGIDKYILRDVLVKAFLSVMRIEKLEDIKITKVMKTRAT